jgi:hypothetical protein
MLSPEGASGVLRMVDVAVELKAKLAEIDAKMEELRREIVVLDDQRAAFEKVINERNSGCCPKPFSDQARRNGQFRTSGSPAKKGSYEFGLRI